MKLQDGVKIREHDFPGKHGEEKGKPSR
jgi:hypothetical protein